MKISTIVTAVIAVVFALWVFVKPLVITVIQPGSVGILSNLGDIDPKPLLPGLHIILNPVKTVERWTQWPMVHVSVATAATTKLQPVTTDIAVIYWLNPELAPMLRSKIGNLAAVNSLLLDKHVLQSLKEVVGNYTAEDLVTKRDEVKNRVQTALNLAITNALGDKDKALTKALEVKAVAITRFGFGKDFNDSINQKVMSDQDAQKSVQERDETNIRTGGERDAAKKRAEANAYRIEVLSKARAEAIKKKTDALKANPGVIDLRLVQAWDGEVPEYYSCGKLPFINVELVPCPRH